ncbi:MAG: hypothetical protein ACQEQI_06985 [Bacillota bacterium]
MKNLSIDFNNWKLGGKFIFISGCAAVMSLFMKWVDIGLASQTGWQQQGYLFLLLFIYPVYKLLQGKEINKVLGVLLSGLSVVMTLFYISSKSQEIFGEQINVASNGVYLFLVASLGLLFGVLKYEK